jgi:hypothetical protein
VKALAYAHASEGVYSPEIGKLKSIDRFGVEAITGRRVLYFREYRHMIHAENVVAAYKEARILAEAEKLHAND